MKFLLFRCLAALPTLFAVVCLGFMMTRLLPGDPATLYASQPGMTEAEIGALRTELALDKPLPAQFGAYVVGLAGGDLGYSRAMGRPVAEEIARRLSLSAKTVNTHKSRLFEKIGIQDGMALARLATQYGLLDVAAEA